MAPSEVSRGFGLKTIRTNSRSLQTKQTIPPPPAIIQPKLQYTIDCSWYTHWVTSQIQEQPTTLFAALNSQTDNINSEEWLEVFLPFWQDVWSEIQQPDSSIDKTISSLAKKGTLSACDDRLGRNAARHLIFAVIGWQTMLFRPDIGSCSQQELAIVDETNGYRGQAHMCVKQDQYACTRSIHDFLKGFGVMLPCRNYDAFSSDEDRQNLTKFASFAPEHLNAELLSSIGGIRVLWTDSLSCHLELDRGTNALYLFRFPSFCLLHLAQGGDKKSTLNACALDTRDNSYWATQDEVSALLHEILLSYRLLFGQHKGSRRRFRSSSPFHTLPPHGHDKALEILCGRKTHSLSYKLEERKVYDARLDFPILGSRLAVLAGHFSKMRPRMWRELWNDRRDSAAWYTFWAVLLIGGLGIFLGLVQTVCQVLSTAIQLQDRG